MLVIRQSQIDSFRGVSSEEFENYMQLFIRSNFPEELSKNPENVDLITRSGVKRAAAHKIYEGPNVSRYITCMLYLGSDFDQNPFLPWAAEMLAERESESDRIESLAGQTLEFLDQTSGADNGLLFAALKRLEKPLEEVFPANRFNKIDDYILDRLNWFYPEKYQATGDRTMKTAVRAIIETGAQKNIAGDTALGMFAGLIFMLGINFESDPIYPWLAEKEDRSPEINNIEAIYRLYRRTTRHVYAKSEVRSQKSEVRSQ